MEIKLEDLLRLNPKGEIGVKGDPGEPGGPLDMSDEEIRRFLNGLEDPQEETKAETEM